MQVGCISQQQLCRDVPLDQLAHVRARDYGYHNNYSRVRQLWQESWAERETPQSVSAVAIWGAGVTIVTVHSSDGLVRAWQAASRKIIGAIVRRTMSFDSPWRGEFLRKILASSSRAEPWAQGRWLCWITRIGIFANPGKRRISTKST
eukprot:925755-Amphidinium_carterae.1